MIPKFIFLFLILLFNISRLFLNILPSLPILYASSIALSDRNKSIDLIHLIDRTKYGKDGIGGIITNGTMYVGYPR